MSADAIKPLESTPLPTTPPREIDVRVGRNLRSARKRRKLTQRELGAGVGLTLQQIQKYENGSNRINVSRLHQFSEMLDVPVSQFFAGPGDTAPAKAIIANDAGPAPSLETPSMDRDGSALSPDDLELLTLIKSVRPRLRRRLICLIEEMVDD